MCKPLISVIIPCYNGANYLPEAIGGIKKQNMNIEIIVVDDCSMDNSGEIAERLGCLVIRHKKNLGQMAGKNTGLKTACGGFILFHDQDDVMNPNCLGLMYNEMEADCFLQVVMAKVKDFFSPDMPDRERQKIKIKPEAYYGLFTGAVLLRKNIFNIIGLFDENLYSGETIFLQSKLNEYNLKHKKIDIISTNRRIHHNNFGRTYQDRQYVGYAVSLRTKLMRGGGGYNLILLRHVRRNVAYKNKYRRMRGVL
jgi:glycosyltransferase involved in cell wall biosynthesis